MALKKKIREQKKKKKKILLHVAEATETEGQEKGEKEKRLGGCAIGNTGTTWRK